MNTKDKIKSTKKKISKLEEDLKTLYVLDNNETRDHYEKSGIEYCHYCLGTYEVWYKTRDGKHNECYSCKDSSY